jgi:TolA-binding protein
MFLLASIIVFQTNYALFPSALLVVLMPLVHRALYIVETPPPKPMYGAAQGKINFGKYEDAEIEVINQLEKKDNDFNGWMMLAELYATKYRRLEDAAKVIVDLCRDPGITDIEASVACNKLADWQLEIGMNPPAARAALDLLIQRAPSSHAAQMAQLRLKQMPRTREDLLDTRKPKSIRLPALREHFGAPTQDASTISRHDASREANRLSDRLRYNPNDFEARERLAILLAEHLGQVNLGIEQLRLMLAMPEMLGEKAAKFLAQIATWERNINKNEQKFRAILNEIIRFYPNTTYALSARRQLHLIEETELQKTVAPHPPTPPPIRLEAPET